MGVHALFGSFGVSPKQSLDDRCVLRAVAGSPVGGEGAPLHAKPLILIADKPQDRVQACQQLIAGGDENQVVKRRVALLEWLELEGVHGGLMGGHDRLEIGKIRVGGRECGRLWLDDLSHRDRVRRTDSKEPVHDPREVDFSVPPEKRAAPHLASERATRADALDRGADRIARDAIFIREMTLHSPDSIRFRSEISTSADTRFGIASPLWTIFGPLSTWLPDMSR